MSVDHDNVPAWIWVLIGVGVCAPTLLILLMMTLPTPPPADEILVVQQREQEVARQRAVRLQALCKDRNDAAKIAVAWGGGCGLVLGILTLLGTSQTYTTYYDVWDGLKVGGQKVTETESSSTTHLSTKGVLALFCMPVVGVVLSYTAVVVWYFPRIWLS